MGTKTKFKVLKELPGIPVGTVSDYADGSLVTINGRYFAITYFRKFPDFFEEFDEEEVEKISQEPIWTDEDMLSFASYSRSINRKDFKDGQYHLNEWKNLNAIFKKSK